MSMMRSYTILRSIAALIPIVLVLSLQAQDLHYSQFYNSPLNQNPALTGLFKGDHRYTVSYRDQWRYVPVPWQTFSASYDTKLKPLSANDHIAVGGNFNYDRQGDSRMNLSALNLTGSYSRLLNKSNIVTLGALVGLASRGFNESTLTWDKQWDLEVFNPNLPSGENFDLKRLVFMETGLGLNYRLQRNTRTKLDVGVGGYHLYKPTTNFYNNDGKRLPTHIALSAVGSIKVADPVDIQLHVIRQVQDKYREMIFGGLAKIYVSQKRGKETELHLGLGYRTAKSLIPTIAVQYKDIYASFSYDIDNTAFNNITSSSRGGPEIHVRYIIAKVPSMEDRKVCPVY